MSESLDQVAGKVAVCCRSLEAIRKETSWDRGVDTLLPAASVIKVGIMAALLSDVASGRYRLQDRILLTPEDMVEGAGVLFEMESREYSLAELCRLMMVVSDNTASNLCLRQVGMERLNSWFASRGYRAQVQRLFMHPIIDGKDNLMTAESACLMLADLYAGVGLDSDLKEFALTSLRGQQYREKIPLMLPADVVVGHKTGELDGVRHDAAVIESEEPYVLAVFTALGREPWLVDRAIALHSLQVFESRKAIVVS